MSNYEFWDELGKIFNAVVAYQEKSVEFNKRFIHPWIRLGNVFDQDDRNNEAVRAYRQAVELDPSNAQNWYELGNIHFRMKNYDEAVEAYGKAIELGPDSGRSYSNLALTLVTQGKHIEAVPLYQKSIELLEERADKAVAWNRLGNVYRKLNEYALALQAFQKADELDGENAGFRDSLDEVAEGPTLVEGADPAVENSVIGQPLMQLIAESQSEETAAGQALAELEQLTDDVPVETAGSDAVEAESAAGLQIDETAPVDISSEAAALEAAPELGPIMEMTEAAAADPVTDLPVSEPVPAWVTAALPVEIVETPEEEAEALEDTQPVAAFQAEDPATTETADAATAPAIVMVAPAAEEEHGIAVNSSIEEVAAVDPAQSFDEIVLTDEPAANVPDSVVVEATPVETQEPIAIEVTAAETAEQAPIEDVPAEEPVAVAEAQGAESVEAAATNPEVRAEAESSAAASSAAQEETVEAPEEHAVPEHAAYDAYLQDNESLQIPLAESGEAVSVEAAPSTSHEPVAKIDPSGDVQIEMDTKNAHVWNELGNVYFNTGAYDDAIAAYTKAIELDRWFAWPYSNLALAYMQKGRFAEAILLYQRSIELFTSEKDKAISWNRLGNVYRRLNDYDNAIASYQRADELDPENTTLSLQSRFSLLGTFNLQNKPSFAA